MDSVQTVLLFLGEWVGKMAFDAVSFSGTPPGMDSDFSLFTLSLFLSGPGIMCTDVKTKQKQKKTTTTKKKNKKK